MIRLTTLAHGMLDYATAGTLFALPRLLNLSPKLTGMMTGAAAGTLLYSMMTRYELGIVKALPMSAHLGLDVLSGLAFCAAPLIFRNEEPEVKTMLLGIGLFELSAALMTNPQPTGPSQNGNYEGLHDEYRRAQPVYTA